MVNRANRMMVLPALLLAIFVIPGNVQATIIHVPVDQPTIQAGIDSAFTGDTVLVDTGRYVENINFNGKNLFVGSWFLVTGDTSFISQTVIDGNQDGSVVTFENGEDSTAVLSGFTISNGEGYPFGGGIHCSNYSSPFLSNLTVIGNTALSYGGGIYCQWYSSPILNSVTIIGNSAYAGGGMFCAEYSSPTINNVTVKGNSAEYGGGIFCWINSSPVLSVVTVSGNTSVYGGGLFFSENSNADLENVIIEGNSVVSWSGQSGYGGGIACFASNPSLINVMVRNNKSDNEGGGMYCEYSSPSLENVTLTGNSASYGGGICTYGSIPIFDPDNRCNIYNNYAFSGGDLYDASSSPTTIPVVVDTFTVMNPTDYHVYPVGNFTFDILHGKIEQVDGDLYVSPDGNDVNSGESPSEPLRSISFALSKIFADSLNPHKIYVDDGSYSPSAAGEHFPLSMVSYVSLSGESQHGVILDAEGKSRVMFFHDDRGMVIENLTITRGSGNRGGGIMCQDNSSPTFRDVTVSGNTAEDGGAIYVHYSVPSLENVTMDSNTASGQGGGIYLLGTGYAQGIRLKNCSITYNRSDQGGGIYNWSRLFLEGTTIAYNIAETSGGGIWFALNYYYSDGSPIEFSSDNRSNIYLNISPRGSDLNIMRIEGNFPDSVITVVVDTFTVSNPAEVHAYPMDMFEFDILHGKVEPASEPLYVNPDGNDVNDGLSPLSPMRTITRAIAQVLSDSMNPVTIHLSPGIYSQSTTGEPFPILLRSWITLKGAGTGLTILDGENQSRLIKMVNLRGVKLAGIEIRNGYDQHQGGGIYAEQSDFVIDSCSIRNCSARSGGGLYISNYDSTNYAAVLNSEIKNNSGGGLRFNGYSALDLINCIIDSNSSGGVYLQGRKVSIQNSSISGNSKIGSYIIYGGGIESYADTLEIINTTISGNSGVKDGGGVFIRNSSYSLLSDCIITDNQAYANAGGVGVMQSNLQIIGSTISGNEAFSDENPTWWYTTGGQMRALQSSITITGTTFEDNYALGSGGGLMLYESNAAIQDSRFIGNSTKMDYGTGGGGVCLDESSEAIFEDCIFEGNSGGYGGGIQVGYRGYSKLIVKRSIFRGNSAIQGGGCYGSRSDLSFDRCLFAENFIMPEGEYLGGGAGISVWSGYEVLLTNCTFVRNEADEVGGLLVDTDKLSIINSIFWDNTSEQLRIHVEDNFVISHSIVQGGQPDQYRRPNDPIHWDVSNLELDPVFVDTENGDYTLRYGSPAIDSGVPLFVWYGDTLVNLSPEDYSGSAPDMGAFEFEMETFIPKEIVLEQNYPNPFNRTTTILFGVPENQTGIFTVYNLLGQVVTVPVDNKIFDAGIHKLELNAGNFASGLYFYRIRAGKWSETRKMTVIK